VSLVEAATRPGFDLTRHSWSLLALGDFGWVHVIDFLLTGAMTVAFAVGLRRATGTGWAPRLVAGYGVGLIGAGLFRADPSLGFPPGTPAGPGTVSWHGMLHLLCGAVAFGCLVAACLVLARRYAAEGRRGWAGYSRVTGLAVLAGFGCVATAAGASWAVLTFTAAVVLGWAWLAAVAVDRYRTA
jgi:Protein of unknown function (DUF998)